jgi:zinc-binding in reverse transcriptase
MDKKLNTSLHLSAYSYLLARPLHNSSLWHIWDIKGPLRITIFSLLAGHNRILTTNNLRRRGWRLTSICYMCRTEEETTNHLFITCSFTHHIRDLVRRSYNQLTPCYQFINQDATVYVQHGNITNLKNDNDGNYICHLETMMR